MIHYCNISYSQRLYGGYYVINEQKVYSSVDVTDMKSLEPNKFGTKWFSLKFIEFVVSLT